MTKPIVGILMGSNSDMAVMEAAGKALEEFGVPFEMAVTSAHRTPERAADYARNAEKKGIKVIIAGAGMAAHLAGFVAAHTTVPVIGVPLESGALKGLDSLLSTVQMPPGIPVATVAINGAKNAGILAAEILALSDKRLTGKLKKFREEQKKKVEGKSKK